MVAALAAPSASQCASGLLVAGDAVAGEAFGRSLAIDGELALIGSPNSAGAGLQTGAAYVFQLVGSAWVEVAKLTASDAARGDQFGFTVALSGETALICARGDDDMGMDAGAAYVFQRTGGVWGEVTKLTASDGQAMDDFGVACALDGTRAVIGAPSEDTGGLSAGAAYVFEFDGSSWTETAKLVAAEPDVNDVFGSSVGITDTTVIVGAGKDDDANPKNPNFDSGAAYFFEKSAGTWSQFQKVTASDAAFDDLFGIAVAIDKKVAVIGAMLVDGSTNNEGAAYVFERQDNETPDNPLDDTWIETDKIAADDAANGDQFGQAVAIFDKRIVIGSPRSDQGGNDRGAVYVFIRTPPWTSDWGQAQKLVQPEAQDGDAFGNAVAIGLGRIGAGSSGHDSAGENSGAVGTVCLGTRYYVRPGAPGIADGSSWSDAFAELQDALVPALAGDEIWVATGTYRPDQGAGQTGGDRSATFQLVSGVEVYGGFDGTEPSLADRAGLFAQTVLDGDLAGDDGPSFANREDNSIHVVLGSCTDSTARLDGFTVRGGNANAGTNALDGGGGLQNRPGDPMVAHCRFTDNSGGNFGNGGGAVYNKNSSPVYLDCVFDGNRGIVGGGAMWNQGSDPLVVNSRFLGNTSPAMDGKGAAVANRLSTPTFVNCEFSGNFAQNDGGAIYDDDLTVTTLLDCSLWGNGSGAQGGGLSSGNLGSSPVIHNSILWGNFDLDGTVESSQITTTTPLITSSCIQGLTGALGGTDNIGLDPQFVDPDGADDVAGTLDDDLRLVTQSPCINAADDDELPPDSLDLDDDGNVNERIPVDLAGAPRSVFDPMSAGLVPDDGKDADMGAYERVTLQADVDEISVATGGIQTLSIAADPALSGQIYLMAGTATGVSPGLTLNGLLLPLNYDAYFQAMLVLFNSFLFVDTAGFVAPDGTGTAYVNFSFGLQPAHAGLRLNHAYVVFDGAGNVVFTSNVAELRIEP